MTKELSRYLVISDEVILTGPKNTRHTHLDIIPAVNIDAAIKVLQERRPNIDHYTYLSSDEVNSIWLAMNYKSDKEILEKFLANTI